MTEPLNNNLVDESCFYSVQAIEGKGRGLFAEQDVKQGDVIILENPSVIGPKQTSPLGEL